MRVAEDHTYFMGSPLWGFSVWAHNTDCRRFREILEENGFPKPKAGEMTRPHAHHILFKRGIGEEQQAMVRQGQDILRGYDIDPINEIENLVWAPNIRGQHTTTALKKVVDKLIQLKADDASRDEVVAALRQLVLQSRLTF